MAPNTVAMAKRRLSAFPHDQTRFAKAKKSPKVEPQLAQLSQLREKIE
jgi:hypothetical protein